MVTATEQQLGFHYNYDLQVEERRALREAIRGMVRQVTLRQAYQGLLDWLGRPEWLRPAGGKLEFADVFQPPRGLDRRADGWASRRPFCRSCGKPARPGRGRG